VIQQKITKARALFHQSMKKVARRTERKNTSHIPHIGRKQKSPLLLFAQEVIQNPREMGAACPSSAKLARAMAKLVPTQEKGLVIELGAGTGIITQALLQFGVAPEQLIALERSHSLAKYLRQYYPDITVIEGDAQRLQHLLHEQNQPVHTVVSGLPFRSLPKQVGHNILKQVAHVLPHEGRFIQFTYDLRGNHLTLPSHFQRVESKFIWSNLPPARVDVYQSL